MDIRNKTFPKILVVGRVAWTVNQSTLSNIFKDYPADKLAYICIETQEPDFVRCSNHFQISETALVKKIFKWGTKTSHKRYPYTTSNDEKSLEKSEVSTKGWVRRHRSFIFLYLRELLWRFGGWKTVEMKQFISDFNPDVLFLVGDPLPLMNRLQRYVLELTRLPAAIFMMDDIWSYKSNNSILGKVYRWLLRREVKRLIPACSAHFAISEMMKREYDEIFNIDSVILTKSVEESKLQPKFDQLNSPLKLVYTGNLLYGRDKSLAKVVEALVEINSTDETKAELHIYTQTEITPQIENELKWPGSSFIHEPVPYREVDGILKDSDIVLFVESLEERLKYIARLSFSTKVTDYLSCGKCILAIGDAAIAPIDYLRENNAAQICTSYDEITSQVQVLIEHREKISEFARNAYLLGKEKHRDSLMSERLFKVLNEIRNTSTKRI